MRSKRDPIAELVRIYKETNERATKDEAVREAARRRTGEIAGRRSERITRSGSSASIFRCRNSKAYELLDIHYDIVRGRKFL